MYDTVIIGAGMSGLAAGIRLAYYDQRVCILERHTTIGGLNSFYRLDGRNHDVGLHAVTNYTERGARRGPLARLLRQLRITWDQLALCQQKGSAVRFPDVELRFTNQYELFESEVARAFPQEIDGFRRMVAEIDDYDQIDFTAEHPTAREFLTQHLRDPLLVDMILCPLMYYGNARENDMDFVQFCIMFRSIFVEGFARPWAGVRPILKILVRRFREYGGELRLRSGVKSLRVEDKRVTKIVLEDDTEIAARHVLSSAGWVETMRLCDQFQQSRPRDAGMLSFVETISVLDKQPQDLGIDETIVFFNDHDQLVWRRPDDLVDPRSGVICSPNNFHYEKPLPEGLIRVTALANHAQWQSLSEDQYRLAKLHWYDKVSAASTQFVNDYRSRVIATDMFTPTTIVRFTGHDHGAIYGAPQKQYDGCTHLDNLFVCGTDQGFVGIVGTIVSGLSMANKLLAASA